MELQDKVFHSSWPHFVKDFIFSIVLIIIGIVIVLLDTVKQSLVISLGKVFATLDQRHDLGLSPHLSDAVMTYVPVSLFVIALLINISILYRKKLNYLELDKEFLIKRYGFPLRRSVEIKYTEIRAVEVWQGWLDKILRIGDVAVARGGSQGYEIQMNGLEDPDGVATLIRDLQKSSRKGKLSGVTEKYDFY